MQLAVHTAPARWLTAHIPEAQGTACANGEVVSVVTSLEVDATDGTIGILEILGLIDPF